MFASDSVVPEQYDGDESLLFRIRPCDRRDTWS
jgi:hypothetical protein